jgi:hypothetical protein
MEKDFLKFSTNVKTNVGECYLGSSRGRCILTKVSLLDSTVVARTLQSDSLPVQETTFSILAM